jgi:hypothetical protein
VDNIGVRSGFDLMALRAGSAEIARSNAGVYGGAIERPGDHQGAGPLSDAFGTGKKQTVRESLLLELRLQSFHNSVVSDEGIKSHR